MAQTILYKPLQNKVGSLEECLVDPASEGSVMRGYVNSTTENGLKAEKSLFEGKIRIDAAPGSPPVPREQFCNLFYLFIDVKGV